MAIIIGSRYSTSVIGVMRTTQNRKRIKVKSQDFNGRKLSSL